MNVLKQILYSFFLLAVLVACHREEHDGSKEVVVKFIDAEMIVSQVQILVFEEGLYKYRIKGKNIVNGTSTVTFSAPLRPSAAPLELLFIANADDAIVANEPAVGETVDAVKIRIVEDLTTGATYDFAMFGYYSLPAGINTLVPNTISGINLLHNIARIDVIVDGSVTNFQLVTIQAFRANTLSQVIPNSLNSNLPVTSPSIPPASVMTLNTTPITVVGTASQSELYLPESAALAEADRTIGATCVVVGGYFNGSTTLSYYRMDFNSRLAGHQFGQILRNHRYVFEIHSVEIEGFATAQEAADNPSTNIAGPVKIWDDVTTFMTYDGDNFLGVSHNALRFTSFAGLSQDIAVDTDAPAYTLQWADGSGVGQGNPAESLNDGIFSVTKVGTIIRVTTLTLNTSGAPFVRYLLITANNLRLLISLRQTIFGVTPQSFVVSPSGGSGYLLVSSDSPWGLINNASWISGVAVGDSLKWTAQSNPVGLPARSGSFLLANFDGEEIMVPFVQPAANPTTLRIHSIRSYVGYLGAGSSVSTAEIRAQGLKGILTNGTNFGLTGKVHFGGFVFTDNTVMNVADTTNLDIFYSPDIAAQSVISVAQAQAIKQWLESKTNRVLVICFDEQLRNKNLLDAFGVTNLIYPGVAGAFPLQFTAATLPFTTTGAFTSYPSQPLGAFSFRNYDTLHAEIVAASYPNITPILLGPSGGIVLGVDYSTRVVYVGDVDLFSNVAGIGATDDNHILNITGVVNNSASRLIANLWGWIARKGLGEV